LHNNEKWNGYVYANAQICDMFTVRIR